MSQAGPAAVTAQSRSTRPVSTIRRRRAALGVIATVSALALCASAAAQTWSPLPGSTNSDTSTEPALQALPGGGDVLLYRVPGPSAGRESIIAATLSPTGTLGSGNVVISDWASLNNPGLTFDGGALRAYWGGIQDTSIQSPVPGLETATASGPGGPWSHPRGGIEVATCQAGIPPCPDGGYLAELYSYASEISATATPAGPLAAWSGTLGVYVRAGTNPARDSDAQDPPDDPMDASNAAQVNQEGLDDPNTLPAPSFQAKCCGYEPQLAIDSATGRPYLAWWSNDQPTEHLNIAAVDPSTGAPASSAYVVPRGGEAGGLRGRTPLTGLPGHALVYTAYPAGRGGTQVRMAGFGFEAHGTFATPSYLVDTGEGEVRNTAIAADGAGHLWVVWTRDEISGFKVAASRYDISTGRFSAPTVVDAPHGTTDSYALDAVALGDGVEVFGTFGPAAQGGFAEIWHGHLSPSSTVAAPPVTVARGRTATVPVRVTVAGRPIAGALVQTVGAYASAARRRGHRAPRPRQARTDRRGIARLRLGPFNRSTRVRLKITQSGFVTQSVVVRVRVRRH